MAWIWWTGAFVWLADSFLSLRHSGRGHALLALMLAILFAVMAWTTREQKR